MKSSSRVVAKLALSAFYPSFWSGGEAGRVGSTRPLLQPLRCDRAAVRRRLAHVEAAGGRHGKVGKVELRSHIWFALPSTDSTLDSGTDVHQAALGRVA